MYFLQYPRIKGTSLKVKTDNEHLDLSISFESRKPGKLVSQIVQPCSPDLPVLYHL